LSFQLPNYAY
jgi:hypothetical protein